ncbi:MAG: response regulator [Pseudobdellovibrionaceae bacterium]|nr:response regulator [Pseudobdellovibrionaceae bacterium]
MDQIRVLFIDDDSGFLNAAREAFSRKVGYDVIFCDNLDTALEEISSGSFEAIVIDCLMPGKSGIDFFKEHRARIDLKKTKVIFISGIFNDSVFMKETLASTKAHGFLIKPFDFEELFKLLPQPTGSSTNTHRQKIFNDRVLVYQIFSHKSRDQRQVRKILEEIEFVHGYDLPFVFNLLVEQRMTGFLNLQGVDNQIYGVTFSDGKIIGVDIDDKKTILGTLLLEKGFVLPADLDFAATGESKMRIGDRLIKHHLLSPHALDIGISEQMSLRLSRLIIAEDFKFNFVPHEIPLRSPYIDEHLLNLYLHDWISSKVSINWIRAQLISLRCSIVTQAECCQQDLKKIAHLPIVRDYPDTIQEILSEKYVLMLLKSYRSQQELLLKQLYLLLAKGIVYLQERDVAEFSDEIAVLDEFIYALKNEGSVVAVAKMFMDMHQNIAIDDLTLLVQSFLLPYQHSNQLELRDKAKQAMRLFQQLKAGSFDVGGGGKSSDYDKKKAEAFQLFEEGKELLNRGRFRDALSKFHKALSFDVPVEKLRLHYIWAKLLIDCTNAQKEALIRLVGEEMLKIPPEDKHEALYYLVYGLFQKLKGNYDQAVKAFEKALALDPQFIHARRELILIQNKALESSGRGSQNILEADLKALVTQLFKKRAK